MRRSIWLLPFLVSCQDYLFDQVCPEAIRESSIVRAALEPTPADILFIVDNSGSMADEQENLAQNFDRFINQIAGAGDYHIAVVTTDTDKTPINGPYVGQQVEFEGLQNFVYSDSYPFILTDFTGNCNVVEPTIPHGCFRGPDASTRIVDSNTMDVATQVAVFAQNVRVGSCGSGNEKALAAMKLALDQRNGCNEGFLRDGANLVVIIVSDEEEANDVPVQQYVEAIKAVKGGAAQIRVAVIAGYADGRASDCSIPNGAQCGTVCDNTPARGSLSSCIMSDDCNGGEVCLDFDRDGSTQCDNPLLLYWNSCHSCSFYNAPDCCSAVAGGRYVDFALRMEAEIVAADSSVSTTDCKGGADRVACRIDTICQANFGDTLATIARDLLPVGTYNLTPPAQYPQGVTVVVKGGRFPEGKSLVFGTDFDVSEDGSVLTIKGENAPRQGETIEINFVVSSDNRVEAPRGACVVSGSP